MPIFKKWKLKYYIILLSIPFTSVFGTYAKYFVTFEINFGGNKIIFDANEIVIGDNEIFFDMHE